MDPSSSRNENKSYLVSVNEGFTRPPDHSLSIPLWTSVSTYLMYFVLIVLARVRDFWSKILWPEEYAFLTVRNGYAPLTGDFESSYARRIYIRVRDCFNRPITGIPGRRINVLIRHSDDSNQSFRLTGEVRQCINLSSYNYLGFAEENGPTIEAVVKTLETDGVAGGGSMLEGGRMAIHEELEQKIAEFVGKGNAIVCNMGFATNSTSIPSLVGEQCLIISDELNHSSLVFGSRLSKATIRVFKHNDMVDLEEILREAISSGQPRTHLRWKKIIVIVEGLYSMEGYLCRLPELISLKRKYKFYLFIDEAHSIGAIGPTGRGVCELFRVDPKEVDILMGTFTKSFGGSGGYIAANKPVIDWLRASSHSYVYSDTPSAPVCRQIIKALDILMGKDPDHKDGQQRMDRLRENSIYFHQRLKDMGFIIYGDLGSPIIPLLLFHPTKMAAMSRDLLDQGIAIVTVAYPATPVTMARIRFCISANLTREDLDHVLSRLDRLGDDLQLKLLKD